MRTAILLGLCSIADAIRPEWLSAGSAPIAFIIFLWVAVMDFLEFRKMIRDDEK